MKPKRYKPPLSDEEWERRFQKHVDQDYYKAGERRGLIGSTLSGITYHINRPKRTEKQE